MVAWVLVGLVLIGAATLGAMRLSGYELLSVASDSMRPAFQKGDAVFIATKQSRLKVGQIISYRSPVNPTVIITHRLIGVDTKRGIIVTKGDNAPAPDDAISESAVVGHQVGQVPLFGYLLDGVRHPIGLLTVVYLPALSILAAEYRRLTRYYTAYAPRRYVLYR